MMGELTSNHITYLIFYAYKLWMYKMLEGGGELEVSAGILSLIVFMATFAHFIIKEMLLKLFSNKTPIFWFKNYFSLLDFTFMNDMLLS